MDLVWKASFILIIFYRYHLLLSFCYNLLSSFLSSFYHLLSSFNRVIVWTLFLKAFYLNHLLSLSSFIIFLSSFIIFYHLSVIFLSSFIIFLSSLLYVSVLYHYDYGVSKESNRKPWSLRFSVQLLCQRVKSQTLVPKPMGSTFISTSQIASPGP